MGGERKILKDCQKQTENKRFESKGMFDVYCDL